MKLLRDHRFKTWLRKAYCDGYIRAVGDNNDQVSMSLTDIHDKAEYRFKMWYPYRTCDWQGKPV